MKKLLKYGVLGGMAVACALPVSAVPTSATLFLWDTANDATKSVTDGAGGDLSGSDGHVLVTGAVGPNWTLNTDTGTSKPNTGSSPTSPYMDTTYNQASSVGAGTIKIAFWDNGWGPTANNAFAAFTSTFQHVGSTASFQTYTRSSQVAPTFVDTGGTAAVDSLDISGWTLLTSQSFTAGALAQASTVTGPQISGGANPFSLLTIITITHLGQSQTTGDAYVSSVPEGGATLVLLGAGLAALGFCRRSCRVSVTN